MSFDDIIEKAIIYDRDECEADSDFVDELLKYISDELGIDRNKSEKIYGFAYMREHSSGYESVCNEINSIVELIKSIK